MGINLMEKNYIECKIKCKCEHCGHEFCQYFIFGNPDENFDYKWKCRQCEHINTLHVEVPQQFKNHFKR